MSRILLVRHGQSTWNAAGRWQGRADPPLSELGERQAAVAIERLGDRAAADGPIGQIWTSPLRRARQTADGLGAGLALDVTVDPRLQEWDAGEWTGLTRTEIEAAWPGYLAERRRPPGFEPEGEVLARALEVLDDIAAVAEGAKVLVITHGGLIRVVERHLGADEHVPVPNLGAREVGNGSTGLVLGERQLLVDPDAVEVTTPRQI